MDEAMAQTQLMQMAVETDQQGKGVGKLLVKELLAFSQSMGIKDIACHAREIAENLITHGQGRID